jgi:hypothetical protein
VTTDLSIHLAHLTNAPVGRNKRSALRRNAAISRATTRLFGAMRSAYCALLCALAFQAQAQTPPVGCTINQYGRVANGATMWATTDQGIPPAQLPPFESNCMINQFAYNNFLYLVGDDGKGHPRFMSLAAWYNLFPTKGVPVWPGTYTTLDGVQLNKAINQQQAGDQFLLLDVASQTTVYDIRVNKPFFDYVNNKKLYLQANMNAAATAFNANSYSGGVFFPPTDISDKSLGAMEIKTSWRSFGSINNRLCPSDIMHCEVDDENNVWGLAGLHLVQKTNTHGEFVWASFEHTANAPDCNISGGNPLARLPADPTKPGSTINVNKNYKNGLEQSGWNYFDFVSYRQNGGDGKSCVYPTQKGSNKPLCNTWPGSTAKWLRADICRTDVLASPTTSCVALNTQHPNSQDIACLNSSVIAKAPSGLAPKWKYYKLIGMEWLINGNTEGGGFGQGCFLYAGSDPCPNFKKPGGESAGAPKYTRAGSTTMANTSMETWMQNGMYLVNPSDPQDVTSALDCFACHQPQTVAKPGSKPASGFNEGDMSHLFSRIGQ